MKTTSILRVALFALILLPTLAFAGVRDDLNRSFSVDPGGTLVLDADYGDIAVRTSVGSTVEVRVIREARTSDSARARRAFDDFRVDFKQTGNRVEVTAEGDDNWGWFSKHLNVVFEVSVPGQFNVNLRTSGGDISVEDLEGFLDAKTSGGDLLFGNVDGRVQARTSGGDITLRDVSGDVDVKTSGGDVHVGRVGGRVEARSSGGDIDVRGAAAEITVSTSGGDIDLYDIEGPVNASTSGGDIEARLTRSPIQASKLGTSGGSITLFVAQGVSLDIDATSRGGRVTSDLPLSITEMDGHDRIEGSINGGGSRLVLRSSSGGIEIRELN